MPPKKKASSNKKQVEETPKKKTEAKAESKQAAKNNKQIANQKKETETTVKSVSKKQTKKDTQQAKDQTEVQVKVTKTVKKKNVEVKEDNKQKEKIQVKEETLKKELKTTTKKGKNTKTVVDVQSSKVEVKTETKSKGRQTKAQKAKEEDKKEDKKEDQSKDTSDVKLGKRKATKKDNKKEEEVKKEDKVDKKVKKEDEDNKEEQKIVTLKVKGKAAVDQYVPNKDTYTVLQTSSQVYAATLNQSNVEANNNKFYILQVIKKEGAQQNYLFTRWGRVGVPGQQALQGPLDESTAIREYQKKMNDKIKGGYIEIEINLDNSEPSKDEEPKKNKKQNDVKSRLDESVMRLMDLIFDTKLMNQTMKEIGYDAKKMPLGKLGDNTIKQAYEILNDLSVAISKDKKDQINSLNSRFYSLIPHDFGFQKMSNFILKSEQQVQQKCDLLQSLTDMKLATKLLEESNDENENVHDQNYKKLKCKIVPVKKGEKDYDLIQRYINDTNNGDVIEEIFRIDREGETQRFDKSIGNDHLIWHGSRVSNFGGILSQGLRIAPPEAPHNGYVYGKGLYFANQYQTSQGYSAPTNNTRLILLCQVGLGKTGDYLGWSHFEKTGKNIADNVNSALGFSRRDLPDNAYEHFDGMKVPVHSKKTGIGNAYIVYNVNQAKMRYLIRLKTQYGW